MFRPVDLLPILLGAVLLVLAHYLPDLRTEFLASGGLLMGQGLPNVSAAMRAGRQRRDTQAGHATPGLVLGLAFAALAVFAGLVLYPRFARAEVNSPPPAASMPGTIGGTHLRIIAPLTLSGLNLHTGKVDLGAYPGGGIGLGYDAFADKWYTLTPHAMVAVVAVGEDRYARIAGGFELFKFALLDTMVSTASPLSASTWYILAGVDPIGLARILGTP